MIKAWLLDVDYITEHGRAIIRLWCKNENGVFVAYDRNFLPYFYVLKDGEKPTANDILNVKVRTKTEVITPLRVEEVTVRSLGKEIEAFKVYTRHPQHVPKLREEIKKFAEVREADIPFAYRYLIDKDLACLDGIVIEPTAERSGIIKAYEVRSVRRDERPDFPELKVLAFDCEMLSEFGMPDAEEDPIIVIGVKSSDFEELYHGDNEREIILKFVNAIKKLDPDVIVGYNQDAFDWPYLKKRAEKHGIRLDIGRDRSELTIRGGRPKIAGRLNVDLYDIALKMSDVKVKKLENVAEYLGTKVELADIEAKDIYKYWTKGEREKVLRYAKQDVLNTYFIAEELLPMHYELAKLIRLPLDDVTRIGRGKQVDYLLLSEAHKIGEVAPNPLEIEESYEGAFVLEPAKGLHENVLCLDFASMYPSIMIAYNISPDTLVKGRCEDCYVAPEVGHKFRKSPDGFFRRILRMLIERRREIKKRMKELDPESHEYKLLDIKQSALKVLTNSFYGYTGWTLARWYCRECAEATTAWGRHCIKKSIKIAEDMGFDVLYGDSVSGDTVVYTNKGMKKIKDLFERVDYRIGDREYYIPKDLKVLTIENGKAVFKPVKYVMRHKTKKRMFRVWLSNTWFVDVTEDHSLMGYLNKSKKAKVENIMERIVEVKPTELGKTVKSLICLKRLPYECRSRGYPREVYEFMGLFIGDGSYNSSIGSKNYYLCLSCGNDVDEIVKKVIEPLKAKGYIKNCWISKNRKGDIKVNGLRLVRLMDEFRSSNGKIIPEWLFYESEENISAFLRGLFTADGTVLIRSGKPIVRLTTTSYEIAKAVQNILLRLGIASTIFKESKPNKYLNSNPTSYSYHIYVRDWVLFRERVGFITDRKLKRLNCSVVKDQKCEFRDYDFDLIHPKKVEEIEYDDYVYDIEVEGTHTFFGNNVLLHNTDSLFIKKNALSLEELEKEALKLIDRLSEELPIQIEIDEYYRTIFFVEKKRYAGLTRDGRIVVKGLEVRRGDWCELAKKVQKAVIEIILKEKNPKKALDYVKKVIEEIRAGKVPLEDYVIYKGLTKPPSKYESKQAHVKAALRAMEMGVVYPIGSKVGFVIVRGAGSISDRAYPIELIEDFDGETLSIRTLAGIDKRRIDKDYYIDHQVIPAILRILERFGYTEAQIKGVSKQKTLDAFFS